MSGSYATPLRLDPVPSFRLQTLLIATHGLALMLLPFTGLATGQRLLLAVLLCIAGWQAWQRCSAVAGRSFVRSLSWAADGRVEIVTCNHETVSLQLQPDALVTSWLVVLRLRDAQGRALHLPLLPDMLPAEQFRRLCVRLRIEIPQLAEGGV